MQPYTSNMMRNIKLHLCKDKNMGTIDIPLQPVLMVDYELLHQARKYFPWIRLVVFPLGIEHRRYFSLL